MIDPRAMEIVEDIPVSELLREGYDLAWLGSPQRIGDHFLGAVAYANADQTEVPLDSTIAIIRGDPSEPVRLLRDKWATGAYLSFLDDAGNFYACDLGKLGPHARGVRVLARE